MIYKLYSSDTNALLSKPETGMGYQIIEATKYSRTETQKYIVYNSELAVELDSNFQTYKTKIVREGYSSVLKGSQLLSIETKSIKVLTKNTIIDPNRSLSFSKKIFKKRNSLDKGALDNPKENANGVEVFVRLSAYEDDKRIDFDESFPYPVAVKNIFSHLLLLSCWNVGNASSGESFPKNSSDDNLNFIAKIGKK